ncbi:DJ-1 protein [Neolentinus lepideus HHB14362 ss-1]|uniref:D-lactate dehydratase n=1 Tax=Neolentinus lepideus HHB14362 ss-1 TaxID=1314782 RepID=A0A165UGA9_9AGAM|nr:DJ-1 protein [Neolentinus lepideus HHB14362 ss-1]
MPSALILIADGTEEMEFTITYDTLVRAGVSCTSAYIAPADDEGGLEYGNRTAPPFAKGSRGINILPDRFFAPLELGPDKFDALIIPGGAKGAETIASSSPVQHLVREYYTKGKVVGMICAGSMAAKTSNLPKQALTSHPSVKSELDKDFDYSEESVVVSKNLVTSRGPGTAFPFALTLVELLCGKDKKEEIRGPMVFPLGTPW